MSGYHYKTRITFSRFAICLMHLILVVSLAFSVSCLDINQTNNAKVDSISNNLKGAPKEIELLGLRTSDTIEHIKAKYPKIKCKAEKIFPDCKKFSPQTYKIFGHCDGNDGTDHNWGKKGIFAKVNKCEFVPDTHQKNPVRVTFFQGKVERLFRSYKGIKQPAQALVAALSNRIGSSPKEFESTSFMTIRVFEFKLGNSAFIQLQSPYKIARGKGEEDKWIEAVLYYRGSFNSYFEREIKRFDRKLSSEALKTKF